MACSGVREGIPRVRWTETGRRENFSNFHFFKSPCVMSRLVVTSLAEYHFELGTRLHYHSYATGRICHAPHMYVGSLAAGTDWIKTIDVLPG